MTAPQSKPVPPGLDARGEGLWNRITAKVLLDDAGEVILEEACRCADRLEQLHWLVTGDATVWARLVPDGQQLGEMTLHINAALVEARQQQATFRALLGQLKLGRVALENPSGRSSLDELAAARRRRGAATSDPGGAARE